MKAILYIPRWILMGVVRGYQMFISPHFPSTCRYHPTCSQYALQAFREYGAVKGLILTMHRLGRCHPWGGHGYDPPRWFGEPEPDLRSNDDAGSGETASTGTSGPAHGS